MSAAELPPEYRRPRVNVFRFNTFDDVRANRYCTDMRVELCALAQRREYRQHDVAHVLSDRVTAPLTTGIGFWVGQALLVADSRGEFRINCPITQPFTFDMRQLPHSVHLVEWHRDVMAAVDKVSYCVHPDNVAMRQITGTDAELTSLCRRAIEIELRFRRRLSSVRVQWARVTEDEQCAVGMAALGHCEAMLEHVSMGNMPIILDAFARAALGKVYREYVRQTTPVATLYVWAVGASLMPYLVGQDPQMLMTSTPTSRRFRAGASRSRCRSRSSRARTSITSTR